MDKEKLLTLKEALVNWDEPDEFPLTINDGLEMIDMIDKLQKENEKLWKAVTTLAQDLTGYEENSDVDSWLEKVNLKEPI